MDINKMLKDLNCIFNVLISGGTVRVSSLMNSCSLTYNKLSSYLDFLLSHMFVRKIGKGKYILTKKGYNLINLLIEILHNSDEYFIIDEDLIFHSLNHNFISAKLGLSPYARESLYRLLKEYYDNATFIIPIHNLILSLLRECEGEHSFNLDCVNLLNVYNRILNNYGPKHIVSLNILLSLSSNNLLNAFYKNFIKMAPFSSEIIIPHIGNSIVDEIKNVEFVVDDLSKTPKEIEKYITLNLKSISDVERLFSSKYRRFKAIVVSNSLLNQRSINEYLKHFYNYSRARVRIIFSPYEKFNISSNGVIVRDVTIFPLYLCLSHETTYSVDYIHQLIKEVEKIIDYIMHSIGFKKNYKILVRLCGDQKPSYIEELVNNLSKTYLIGLSEDASRELSVLLYSISKKIYSLRIVRFSFYSLENLNSLLHTLASKDIDNPVIIEYKGV